MARLWWGDSARRGRSVGRIPGFSLDARPIVAIMAFATGVEALGGRVPEERASRGGKGAAAPLSRGTLKASWNDQGERAGRPESSHFVAPPVAGALRGGGSGSLFGIFGRQKCSPQDNKQQLTRRDAMSSAVASALGKGGATALGVLKLASVPYLVVLALLFTFQRTILFPRPADVADPTLSGGRLITLPASEELLRYATHRKNSSVSPIAGAEGVAGEGVGTPQVAAVFFQPPSPEAPTLVYVHGNADQIGWGGAYLGRVMREQHGLGFYGVEFPGYGVSTGLRTEEASMYLAAEQLINHLTTPLDRGGLGVDPGTIVLVGQSIGSAVASEMCLRGKGRSLVLLAPFLSMRKIASSLFPFITPGLLAAPWLLKDTFDNQVKMPRLGVPILVLHGDCDDIVPYWQGKAVSKLNDRSRLVTVPDAAHNDLFASSHESAVVGEIVRFVHGDYGGGS